MRRTAIIASALAISAPSVTADVVEDQNGLATQLFSGIAVITLQSCSQVVTTGVAGTLDSIDFQIWKSPTAVNDVEVHIVSVTDGAPDPISTGSLFSTTLSLADIPNADGVADADTLPLTSVDVSAGGLEFEVGAQFAVAMVRIGPGAPPWVLWGRGNPQYGGGDGFLSGNLGETWGEPDTAFTFRTFVDEAGDCLGDFNGDGALNILDFTAFQQAFQAGDFAADCNNDGALNILDFPCFQAAFAAGCP